MSPKCQLASPCVGSLTLGDAFFLFSLERSKNTLPLFQSKLIINSKNFRETKTFFRIPLDVFENLGYNMLVIRDYRTEVIICA